MSATQVLGFSFQFHNNLTIVEKILTFNSKVGNMYTPGLFGGWSLGHLPSQVMLYSPVLINRDSPILVNRDKILKDIIQLLKGQILQTSAETFASTSPDKRTTLISISLGKVTEPCVVTDSNNIAMLYFLPKLLTHNKQRQFFNSTSFISEKLHASVVPDHKKPVWQVNEIYFTPVKRPMVASGCLNFFPSWLAQGHHPPEDPLVTSFTLSQGNKDSMLEWLQQIDKLQILSNILIK
ncbi:hypothetical protein F5876DRAFT_70354 [Lentinula aff. lateritia]|uniref:Uncharacterized protein n=1 Tax=Lentinula aff. lateritia TaxID=2804960 RepID=A0ACC1TJ22_9AGAR|nr:hypothetical protein F5876DRAFT_70354 [Lentinula aff. lateritia]